MIQIGTISDCLMKLSDNDINVQEYLYLNYYFGNQELQKNFVNSCKKRYLNTAKLLSKKLKISYRSYSGIFLL